MRCVVLGALVLAGCSDWRDQVKAGVAVSAPEQRPVEAKPTALTFGETNAVITARAYYRTKAWVVAVDDGFDDGLEDVMPIDTALAWGPLGNRDVLKTMSFHLARRYVSVRWEGTNPLSHRDVMLHLANHHLVPSSEGIRATLEGIEAGDLVTLEGHLVDIEVGARKMRTSLTRDDKGNGACEILYVERAEVAVR